MIRYEGDNIGGTLKMEAALHTDFTSFDPAVLKPGKLWEEIPFREETAILDIEKVDSENGIIYSFSGRFTLPKLRPEVENILDRRIGKFSILRITDMNGRIYILGAPGMPVDLKVSGSTGLKFDQENGASYAYAIDQPFDFLRA